jgi:hypothetical protein
VEEKDVRSGWFNEEMMATELKWSKPFGQDWLFPLFRYESKIFLATVPSGYVLGVFPV